MTEETRPLAEVTRRAIEVLWRELGAVDAARFQGETLDHILAEIAGTSAEAPG